MAFDTNSALRLISRAALALAICAGVSASAAEGKKNRPGKATHSSAAKGKAASKPVAAPGPSPDSATTEPVPPPYEPQILRLAEILGALSYLDDLCGSGADGGWRTKMQALIDAEARTKFQKERLAGTFNRSFRSYQTSYRACTGNARVIIVRFLDEGGRIAHEVIDRYGAS